MRCRFLTVIALALWLLVPYGIAAQVSIQPTPAPTVVADGEPWYQLREPIMFAGNVYYPAGAQVHFNRNEMSLSGYYGSIPLYTRVTLEPYSLVFVPVSGGLLQPYERKRSGEIAGTVGTTTPSFPIVSPTAAAASGEIPGVPQSPGPAASTASAPPPVAISRPSEPAPVAVGTSGVAMSPVRPGQSISAARPLGLNGIFVEYAGRRWFSSGPAVSLDPGRFSRVGTYSGLPIYRQRDDANTIFVPVAASTDSLLAPYSARRGPNR